MTNSFLKFDLQSITLVILLLVSGYSLAEYIMNENLGLLFTFIGTSLIGYALAADIYRKRKSDYK